MPAMTSNQIRVVAIAPFTPDDESASVTVQSDSGEAVAFCWPCALHVGDQVESKLYALDGDVRAVLLSDWPREEKDAASSERLERTGHFSYRGRGLVIDELHGLVQVHGFNIDFGAVPCDGYVDFHIERLDLRP